ncbi:MAG: type I DNA topoisomerase [Bacteroidetes bacterium]|nr:type I DNA topoisomerase [Bacteroidota bacterium]
MSKDLVLVESPSKAKTINKYLGRKYVVEATVGHIRNLPKTKLGVDVDNGYEVSLLTIRGKADVVKKIKSLASKADQIFIATDPDREGEAIAQDIVEVIKTKKDVKIHRVLFQEITKKAVKKAMESPIEIDTKMVQSQRARRAMDRIIGYKISPFLWLVMADTTGSSLSAGRVQSVALRLICEREEEIEKFILTEYWSIVGNFNTKQKETLETKLATIDGRTVKVQPEPNMTEKDWAEFNKKNIAITNADEATRIFDDISSKKSFIISDIQSKEVKRNPFAPFITSTLQAEGSKKLRLRPRHTMKIAQSLYEGVNVGTQGLTGLITYMRTDSTRLSEDIVTEARNYIKSTYGDEYVPEKPKEYLKKKKNVQDAHEAIRPTSLENTPEVVKEFLDEKQFALYELIWKRFISCQMETAKLETTTVSITADPYGFKASGTVVKFPGFLRIYDEEKEDSGSNGNGNGTSYLPSGLVVDEPVNLDELIKNQHFTKPPPRFSESTLIKELETNGIGRPSTYAGILGTIQDREYVNQIEGRKLVPTIIGKKVNGILVKNFPTILDVGFSAKMEEELDLVATGELGYVAMLDDFYHPFSKVLLEVEKTIEKIKCDKCESDMEIKIGRFGKFLACTNYPECKNIKSLKSLNNENNEPEYTGEDCPKCNSKTIFRKSRFGKFIGCEKYPDCDYTKQITTGVKCPKCKEGDVVTRRSKKGRFFFGCGNYPDCDYISWTKPTGDEETKEQVDTNEDES